MLSNLFFCYYCCLTSMVVSSTCKTHCTFQRREIALVPFIVGKLRNKQTKIFIAIQKTHDRAGHHPESCFVLQRSSLGWAAQECSECLGVGAEPAAPRVHVTARPTVHTGHPTGSSSPPQNEELSSLRSCRTAMGGRFPNTTHPK